MADKTTPHIPPSVTLPEITGRAVVLSIVLSVVLAAANAYLGLFAGMTVSASIPAAVVSMAVLRFFRGSNVLENNAVQTAASSGESLAAGIIFTIPAMVILGAWTDFHYWEITLIGALGGIIGVMFTIPLRRAFIVENPLTFPEGVATAQVLLAGERTSRGLRTLMTAGVIGALFKIGSTGMKLWVEVFEWARFAGGTVVYLGTNLSPALVGVGYIIGLNIAVLVFLGGALNWWAAIPLVARTSGLPAGIESPADAASVIWSTRTRYVGVGAMIIGGLWTLVRVRASLASGIRSGLDAYRRSRGGTDRAIVRTERDAPMPWVGAAVAASAVPLYLVFDFVTGSSGVALFMALVMLGAGFLFSAVAAYMAGLVGSSNNPISGVTIATILTSALLLAALLGTDSAIGPAAAVLIGSVVACAAANAGDNLQDLKAGWLLGATPIKQQVMQIVGVTSAAFVMAPVLNLLLSAYGIGAPSDSHPNPLSAPQATLMSAVAGGVFHGGLPWSMVGWGAAVAIAIIGADLALERRHARFRMPVLAVAVGIYLPLELSAAIFLGGLVSSATGASHGAHRGLLFAAGLITGEALIGVVLAVPIVLAGNADILAPWGRSSSPWPGGLLLVVVLIWLYREATRPEPDPELGVNDSANV